MTVPCRSLQWSVASDRSGAGEVHGEVATALWSSLATSQVAADLAARTIPVLVLKGPPLQQRLLATESAYRSVDVDLLVPRRQGRRARRALRQTGWSFRPDNGLLWRLDRAVALERRGVVVDLHWGVHLGPLPPWTLAPLERALWQRASPTTDGWWEPRPEPLLVYLALHAAAFDYSKPAGLRLVAAAAEHVQHWDEVEALGRRLRAWSAVADALARAEAAAGRRPAEGSAPPLLTGVKGRALTTAMRILRLGVVPEPARRAVRAARDRRR